VKLELAKQIAETELLKHGLTDWKFVYDKAVRRFGCCDYRHKEISLSEYLVTLNDETQVRDTILHEVAHALTPKAGHSLTWIKKALEIGCNGERCYSPKRVTQPAKKYKADCTNCGNTYQVNKDMGYVCRRCGTKLILTDTKKDILEKAKRLNINLEQMILDLENA